MDTNMKVAVLGAGHAGFAHAADLSIKGFEVRLCEAPENGRDHCRRQRAGRY